MRELALPLLVALVLADDQNRAVAADDLALLAHRLDRRSYLHDPFQAALFRRLGSGCRDGCRYRVVEVPSRAQFASRLSRTPDGSKFSPCPPLPAGPERPCGPPARGARA